MYDNYNLFKFSADLQAVLYENEKLNIKDKSVITARTNMKS